MAEFFGRTTLPATLTYLSIYTWRQLKSNSDVRTNGTSCLLIHLFIDTTLTNETVLLRTTSGVYDDEKMSSDLNDESSDGKQGPSGDGEGIQEEDLLGVLKKLMTEMKQLKAQQARQHDEILALKSQQEESRNLHTDEMHAMKAEIAGLVKKDSSSTYSSYTENKIGNHYETKDSYPGDAEKKPSTCSLTGSWNGESSEIFPTKNEEQSCSAPPQSQPQRRTRKIIVPAPAPPGFAKRLPSIFHAKNTYRTIPSPSKTGKHYLMVDTEDTVETKHATKTTTSFQDADEEAQIGKTDNGPSLDRSLKYDIICKSESSTSIDQEQAVSEVGDKEYEKEESRIRRIVQEEMHSLTKDSPEVRRKLKKRFIFLLFPSQVVDQIKMRMDLRLTKTLSH